MAELVREIVIDASPETIWPFLTEPTRHVEWLGTDVEIDPRPGGVYRVLVGGEHQSAGEYLEVVPHEKVVFTFGWEEKDHPIPPGSTTIEITLHPEGEKTRVRLVHRGLPADAVDDHGEGWAHYLERLAVTATGGDAGPDSPGKPVMKTPPIVSAEEWDAARRQLLVKEKELTHARDALAAQRRRMPWLPVEKEYAFDGPRGKASLLDLFEGRTQLIVYRAFFEPGVDGWPDHACRGCSMVADQVAHVAHLNARDTTLAFASRAPQPEIERLKARMGWEMPWYTITDGFDLDFGVDEWHGTNAFIRDGDRVFRTYFVDSRGDEAMGGTWAYLDITALGRQEEWEDSPEGYPQTPPYTWWNWHDEYDEAETSRSWLAQVERGVRAFRDEDAS